jgi:hypothetical protein
MGMMFDEIENRRDAARLAQWSSLLCSVAIAGVLGSPLLQIISNWKVAKIGVPIGAAAAIAGEVLERERLRKVAILSRTEAMAAQSQALHFAQMLSPKQSLKFAQQPELKAPELYQWNQFKQEAAAALIVGPQGAGKDCVAKFLAAQFLPCQILVLDPHNQHNPWGSLPVVDELEAIVEQMKLLRDELNERIQDGKEGEPDRPPLVVFINEWLAIKTYCKRIKSKAADEFLSDFLPQCRKYRIVPILLAQAENVDAVLPPDRGGLKSAFLIIRLVEAAKVFAANLPDPEVREAILKNPGYPCLVNRKVAIHPTHGHYQGFKINGMSPANLTPLNSLPLTIPNVLTAPNHGAIAPNRTNEPHHLAPLLDKAFTVPHQLPHPVPGEWEFPDPKVPLTGAVRGAIVNCVRNGWGQGKTIDAVFGVIKSGNNPNYDAAKGWYQSVKSEVEEL